MEMGRGTWDEGRGTRDEVRGARCEEGKNRKLETGSPKLRNLPAEALAKAGNLFDHQLREPYLSFEIEA